MRLSVGLAAVFVVGVVAPVFADVRKEAWSADSQFREGGEWVTIVAPSANVYAKPALNGTVLAKLPRGESVPVLRKSADKKWLFVDIGGGEQGWLWVGVVKAGRASTGKSEAAKNDPSTENGTPPPRSAPLATTPQSLAQRGTGDEPAARRAPERIEDPKREEPKRSRKDDADFPLGEEHAEVERTGFREHNTIGFQLRLGGAAQLQRFTSNASGALTNYEVNPGALVVGVGFNYARRIGRLFILGLDLSYLYGGVGQVQYNGSPTLQVQSHWARGFLSPGIYSDRAGGIDFRLRVGLDIEANLIATSENIRLPSDLIFGMIIGLRLALPSVARFADRPFGFHLFGDVTAPAVRQQTPNLEEGGAALGIGAWVGGGLMFGLLPTEKENKSGQVRILVDYAWTFVENAFSGNAAAARNPAISEARRRNASHLVTFGIGWQY